jgi:magnesium-transporting ATPase (P-type)
LHEAVQISRSVADFVLVRDDFGVVPGMVAEGRQILRNIQRVAWLFVTKTVFTTTMGLAMAIPTGVFPLLPRQFSIASTVTIGIGIGITAGYLVARSGFDLSVRHSRTVATGILVWASGMLAALRVLKV